MTKPRDDNKGFRLPDNLAEEMDKLVGKHGFTSRAEIAKQAIREYLDKHYTIHKNMEPPQLEKINMDAKGTKILDRKLHIIVQVHIKPNGLRCDYCDTDDCEHINYALTLPEIKKLMNEKRKKDGWNLPSVGVE